MDTLNEYATVKIKKIIDKSGNPVCFNRGHNVCVFTDMTKYGVFNCKIADVSIDDVRCGKQGAIFWNGLNPHEKCPVWKS